jgi:exosortase K
VNATLARLRPSLVREGRGAALLASALAGALTLAATFSLKRFYSQAGASELEWILVPSCWLARLGGVELAYEPGAGFISHQSRMVVGASCAGVNFLIVAWLALFFTCSGHVRGLHRKLAWSVLALLLAYASTIAVNGLRILLAAHFFGAELHAGFLTPSRLHRLLGVVLYCGALLPMCAAAARCFSPEVRPAHVRLLPLLAYLGVVLGIPLLNRAWVRDPERFLEHALLTLGAGGLVALVVQLSSALLDRLSSARAR